MSTNANEILTDENYFLWEFGARMKLAKKGLHGHLEMKPENAMAQASEEWKSNDLKALAIIVSLLGPTYQSMIRNARSAAEAWIILREFHVKRSLHNRVALRKQLHEFVMVPGDNIMDHLLKFDDLCLRLSAVGDEIKDDERLVILLGSLTSEYDAIVKIIEARGNMDLYEVKEVLRREYETIQKREKQEAAFKASVSGDGRHGGRRVSQGRRGKGASHAKGRLQGQDGKKKFLGRCYECGEAGHKRQTPKGSSSRP